MVQKSFEGVPPFTGTNVNEWLIKARFVLNGLLNGKSNNLDVVTLTAHSATTLVTLPAGKLTDTSYINFMPLTANAAIELALGGMYVSNLDPMNDQFTITNTNNAQVDRTFRFIIVG